MTATLRRYRCTVALCALVWLIGCQSQPTEHVSALDDEVLASLIPPLMTRPYTGGSLIAPGVVIPEPDLWREISAGFSLDRNVGQRRVQQEIAWLQRHPDYLVKMRPRLARHLAYIYQQVRERGLPTEVSLLPIVESALDAYAFSHGGAAGLWQFIPSTAKRFGLDRNWWYDGRRDPVAATDAALDYLEDLHQRFDDWYLALAGYNAGEGNVDRARKRSPDAGFFDLSLPRETRAYVPRLLALAEVVAHPDAYGIALPPLSPEVPFITIDTGSQMDLSVASSAAGVDVDTLYLWNPALNQWSTPPRGPHRLLLPDSVDPAAVDRLAAVPEAERVQWLRIKVRSGDTLSELARRYRTDVGSLRRVNQIAGTRITAGDSLLIPKSPAAANPVNARRPGATYVVRPGDSLWTISRAHDVSVNDLMKVNHVGPRDYLRIGQQLKVPGASAASPQAPRKAEIRKVRYGVRRGDSLARIAGKFNVKVKDILSWNAIDISDYLQPGQMLLLYVNAATGGD